MDWRQRIDVDPEVMVGKPVVRGTRIAVEQVIELLAAGWSFEQIVESYPGLESNDILACLAYAREVLERERVFPLPAA